MPDALCMATLGDGYAALRTLFFLVNMQVHFQFVLPFNAGCRAHVNSLMHWSLLQGDGHYPAVTHEAIASHIYV